jgi:ParB family chromosome partitioning protein
LTKKIDLRGNNSARNEVETKMINDSLNGVVQMTKKAISKKKEKPNTSTISASSSEVDHVIDKIVGNTKIMAEYKVIPVSSLVAAPIEWNYFSALSDEKKTLLAESIYYNGLLQPIIVRSLNKDNTSYEILAGHHRAEAYNVLYEITGDKQYTKIEAKIFPFKALTDAQAREIVEDTNFVQRGNLAAKDKAMCIYNKAKALRSRGVKGDIMDMVAGHFGITRATVFFWKKIVDLIPEFNDMFSEGKLTLVNAAKLASFPPKIQKQLYENKEYVTNETLSKIKAKDDPSEVLDKLKKASLPNAGNFYGNIIQSETKDSKFTITVDTPPTPSLKPILLYLPEKKLNAFQKKYGEFVLTEK